jgi:gluconate 2-dehydrogenase gamma chain
MTPDTTRREFFSGAGSTFAAAWLTTNLPGIRAAAEYAARAVREGRLAFETLGSDDAADLGALAEQIFPSDPGSPGAREAGVIHFIDRALGSFAANLADLVRDGLVEINRLAAERYPDGGRFGALGAGRQEALMPAVAALPAFTSVRYLVVAGMFANPSYGGNRGLVGWKLLGFDDRFAWQPPFGYYDRDAHGAR